MRIRRFLVLLGVTGCLLGGLWAEDAANSPAPAPAASATATPIPDATAKDREDAVAALEEARKQAATLDLKALQEELKKNALPESYAEELLAAAEQNIRNYQAAVDLLTALPVNQRVLDDLQRQPDPAPPANEEELDRLRDKISGQRQQIQTVEAQLRLDDGILSRTSAALDAAQQQYRRVSEELEAITDPAARGGATLRLRLADLRQQAASSAVLAARWRVTQDEIDQQIATLSLRQAERVLAASGQDTVFSKKRAATALTRLAQTRDALKPQIDQTRTLTATLNTTVADLGKAQKAAQDAGKTREAQSLAANLAIATESLDLAMRSLQTQENWLTGLNSAEELWRSAQAVADQPTPENLEKVRQQAEQRQIQLDPWRDQLRRSLQDAERRLQELQAAPPSRDVSTRKLQETRLDLIKRRVADLRELSGNLETQFAIEGQMLAESRERLAGHSVKERTRLMAGQLQRALVELWNHELFVTKDDSGKDRGVTLGKLFLAISGLLISLALAKTVSRTVSSNARRRFALDPQRSATIEKVIFVPLLCFIVLTTLNWLHIPLATFAFLGGALAIGVGFGAQTLVNNFISGLILMAERRIKVGDTIEVDTHTGKVLNLGTRCSRISKGNGVEVLVPNSYLLEKNVANWSLAGTTHAFDFLVGFEYGTNLEEAMQLLQKAVSEEPKVLREPRPRVFFEEFGPNALVFRIAYWVDLRDTDNRQVGSNIRVKIDRLCREHKIEIASPQKSVVLRTDAPIGIKLDPPAA